jgi:hypothetical protein
VGVVLIWSDRSRFLSNHFDRRSRHRKPRAATGFRDATGAEPAGPRAERSCAPVFSVARGLPRSTAATDQVWGLSGYIESRRPSYARRLITLIFADRVAEPAVMVMIRRELASYLLRGTAARRTTREDSPYRVAAGPMFALATCLKPYVRLRLTPNDAAISGAAQNLAPGSRAERRRRDLRCRRTVR